jgi:hypothetical protein
MGRMSMKLMPAIGKSGKRRRAASRLIFVLASSEALAVEEAGCRPEASCAVVLLLARIAASDVVRAAGCSELVETCGVDWLEVEVIVGEGRGEEGEGRRKDSLS